MGHHHQQHPATIAILGSGTLAEHVLAMLLEDEGYAAKLRKVPSHAAAATLPPEGGSVEELLGGVDVVLLWPAPTLRDDAGEALVAAMRSASATAKIPVLALPRTLDVAFQDELAVDLPLKRQF